MKGIYCDRNTRQRSDCKYNVDCNNFKYTDSDYVKPLCPSRIENLPSCGINDSHTRCNSILCNFDKHKKENDSINTRYAPFSKHLSNQPYREKYKICNSYTDLNSTDEDLDIDNFYKISSTSFHNFNIDIDSQIKYPPYSKCLDNTELQKNNTFNEPNLISDRLSDNISMLNLNQFKPKPLNNKNIKCSKPTHSKEFQCENQVHPEFTSTLLKFHYPPFTKPCSTGCLPLHVYPLPKHIPPMYSSDVSSKNSVGPDRNNHEYEHLFNNVTRRKHISPPTPN